MYIQIMITTKIIHTQINSNMIQVFTPNWIEVTTAHKYGSAGHGARRVKDNVTYKKGVSMRKIPTVGAMGGAVETLTGNLRSPEGYPW